VADSPIQDIVCCMGQPVAGNPTQFMMERAFAAADLDWRYLTLRVSPENLADAVNGLRAMGFRGGNLDIPHKIAVVQYLDELSEAAELAGAVNCINREGDRLIGENTDGKGFVQSLGEITNPKGKRVVIFGAGGSARAIALEIGLAGAQQLTIVNRSAERGQALVDLLNERVKVSAELAHLSDDYVLDEGTDVVINATSIGSDDEDARVPLVVDSLKPDMVVADVILYPPETRLILDASARGCKTVDGHKMFINEAVIAFRIWTGVDPDVAVMREALEEYLEI